MHIKNTIPAEFVFNSALMKNIENTLIKQHRTVNNERMITEIQHRLQTESNEILSDLYLQALDMLGNDSNLLIVFYVQIMPDDFVMQLHRF